MGETISAGRITYNVIQTSWRTQLGEMFSLRSPRNRYLLIDLSASNDGNREAALPMFTLEAEPGQEYREIEDGTGVDGWFGLLRNLAAAETRQGKLLFDVPLGSYRLRLTDGGEPGSEQSVWVDIPLRLDSDTSIPLPLPEKQ